MQCNCGGETRPGTHQVTTMAKAVEWYADVLERHLPLTITQDKCPGCGRQQTTIESVQFLHTELLEQRG
jgi:hypothetical protein